MVSITLKLKKTQKKTKKKTKKNQPSVFFLKKNRVFAHPGLYRFCETVILSVLVLLDGLYLFGKTVCILVKSKISVVTRWLSNQPCHDSAHQQTSSQTI